MKKIDLENHFFTRSYIDYLRSRKVPPREAVNHDSLTMWYTKDLASVRTHDIDNMMLELGDDRLRRMDEHGIDMQVLSLSPPGVQSFEPAEGVIWAKKVNDELSQVVKRHPDRFIGLACIAPQSPHEAADEIERAVTELGLKGVMLESHARGEYLDDKRFWGIFEKAEKFGMPIYIHPDIPSPAMLKPYAEYGFALAGPALGFAAEVALHTMRLIYSGLFDRYPNLKIILGHMGEGLPYFLNRLDFFWLKAWQGGNPKIERRPSDVIKTNFTVTLSGMFFLPAFACCDLALGTDKIAFAVDYPYEQTEEAIQFVEKLKIPKGDKEKIFHLNAEKLFNI